jgi:hypothetical protein
MRKPIVFATIIVFAVAIIIIPFGTFIVQPTVIAAQHESNSSSSQNTNSSSSQNTNSSSSQNTNSSSAASTSSSQDWIPLYK